MQPSHHASFEVFLRENAFARHLPSCPHYQHHTARIAYLYASFLESIEKNLSTADTDAMNELRQKIHMIKPLLENTFLQEQNDATSYPNDSFNTLDRYLIATLEILAQQTTSSQSYQIRQSFIPVISRRRVVLIEFASSVGSWNHVSIIETCNHHYTS